MGKVYLVGAGPGDPDLITVKGMKAIQASDVILYDRLVNKEILDFANPTQSSSIVVKIQISIHCHKRKQIVC